MALLFAGCCGLYGWAQEQAQTPPAQAAPTAQEAPEQNHPSQQPAAVDSAPAAETTKEYPLDKFQNFSAIQNGNPLPGRDEDRYIYRAGNLMRLQGDAAVPEYFVTNLSKQWSHAIAPSGCLKMGTPHSRSFPFVLSGPGFSYERIAIGEDTVDGHHCRVEDIKVHNPRNPVVMHFRLYEAEDLQGFPVKIENRREHAHPWVIHYKDVRLGPQDPSLFLIPNQCQSMAGMKPVGPGTKAAKPKAAAPAKPQ